MPVNLGSSSAFADRTTTDETEPASNGGFCAFNESHHAPTPELLEACDSLGMLVLDEQRLLNSSPEYTDQFKRLILRDRNHPSVFLWSIGNEEQNIQCRHKRGQYLRGGKWNDIRHGNLGIDAHLERITGELKTALPKRKVSADLSREALGLRGATTLKTFLKDSTIWL